MNKAGEGIWCRGGSVPSSEALTGKVHHLSLIEWSPRDRIQVQVASLWSAQTARGCASTSLSLSFAIRASGGVRGRSGDPGGVPSMQWAFEHGSCSHYFYQTCSCCQLWGGQALSVVETEGPLPRCQLGPRGSQDALWSQGTRCGRGEATGIGPGGWFLFLCYLRHTLTPSSSGLLQAGSQASSKGPGGGGGPAGPDLPWNKLLINGGRSLG